MRTNDKDDVEDDTQNSSCIVVWLAIDLSWLSDWMFATNNYPWLEKSFSTSDNQESVLRKFRGSSTEFIISIPRSVLIVLTIKRTLLFLQVARLIVRHFQHTWSVDIVRRCHTDNILLLVSPSACSVKSYDLIKFTIRRWSLHSLSRDVATPRVSMCTPRSCVLRSKSRIVRRSKIGSLKESESLDSYGSSFHHLNTKHLKHKKKNRHMSMMN